MSTLSFLNSPLLWGLSLAAIPILIHLLYRRQYRKIEWAPMKYLKMSVQRNRQRLRIEQLLLLLLRTAAVLLLFFFLARPVMHAEGLSRLLGGGGHVNRIVVLDDSLSMGYQDQGKTALARGQDILADLLPTFGPKDHLTVLLASQPQSPLLREVEMDDLDNKVNMIRQVRATDVYVAWEGVLKEVDLLIAASTFPQNEVTLITDLRAAGWDAPLSELGGRWANSRVRLRAFDVGQESAGNVAAIRLEQIDRLALTSVPSRFEVHLKNDSDVEVTALEANFIIDGKPTLVRIPSIGRGETIRVPLIATFQEPGTHHVAFELPRDALPGDNLRWLVVDAKPSIDMLLVDGEPSAEHLGGELDYLGVALSQAGSAAETYHLELTTDAQWASSPPSHPDLLVLGNVSTLSQAQSDTLERLVSSGMGLMIFVGDQVDPDNFNQWLYKGGAGLSPAALETAEDAEVTGLILEQGVNSPLDALNQLHPAALQRIKIQKSYVVRMPRDAEGVRVLARWNNADSTPAVIQKTFGQGRVLLWTIAADRAWTDWPTDATFVLAMREASRAIAHASAAQREFIAGQTMRVDFPATHDISSPLVEIPGEKEPKSIVITSEGSPKDAVKEAPASDETPLPARKLVYGDTRKAGLYTIAWTDSVSGPIRETWALNPDGRESALERLEPEEWKKLFGGLDVDVISLAASGDTALAVHGEEIWRSLALCLLGLFLVESCFARFAGRQR